MNGYKDTVGAHMTRSPQCIALTATLQEASDVMRDLGIRHLPVLERGRPVGMVSERDIALAASFSDKPLGGIQVLEAMSPIPYCVTPDTPVNAVARHLATRKLDAALIMSGNRVMGMFTITDALRLLAAAFAPPSNGKSSGEHLSA